MLSIFECMTNKWKIVINVWDIHIFEKILNKLNRYYVPFLSLSLMFMHLEKSKINWTDKNKKIMGWWLFLRKSYKPNVKKSPITV